MWKPPLFGHVIRADGLMSPLILGQYDGRPTPGRPGKTMDQRRCWQPGHFCRRMYKRCETQENLLPTVTGNHGSKSEWVSRTSSLTYLRATSTWTEWSITRSAGQIGLMDSGSPPSRFTVSRIAAKSTTAGTPLKKRLWRMSGAGTFSVRHMTSSLLWGSCWVRHCCFFTSYDSTRSTKSEAVWMLSIE